MLFVVVDIGCIECNDDTSVLGVFESELKAEEVAQDHRERQKASYQGHHRIAVFPVPGVNIEIRREYGI